MRMTNIILSDLTILQILYDMASVIGCSAICSNGSNTREAWEGNGLKKLRREEVNKHYEIREKLGTGSFAIVKKCVRKSDGKEYAVKIVKKKNLNAEELATINEEVEIMNRISHENIVNLIDIYDTPKHLYMVLELLSGGELFERIVDRGQYSEKQAADLVRLVVKAIQYIHSEGVVHRDLKPENLIYLNSSDESPVKITDFGLAKYLPDERSVMNTACGTPGYVAPEILKNEPYDKQVDMWSIGVILYILLCGFPPFYDENAAGLYSQIKRGDYDFPDPYWTEISDQAKDMVSKLLTVDPKKRCTPETLLRHPWIAGQASDKPLGEDFNKRLMKFNARRKLRRGIQMIMAVNRLTRAFAAEVDS
eukprot:256324_1